MTPYIFKGLIRPERAHLSFGPRSFQFLHTGSKSKAEGRFNIVLNQLTVWIYTEDDWDLYDLKNAVVEAVNDSVSVIGFLKGYAYEINIIQVLNDGKKIDFVFGIDIPCISERNKNVNLKESLLKILNKTSEEYGVFLHRAINDLIMAMKHPQDTGFYCFRAIESLKHYCRDRYNLQTEAEQWGKVNSITGYDKEYIKIVREFALPTRHGDILPITSKNRDKIFIKTWDVIESFIDNA